jgi:hypothetical protein
MEERDESPVAEVRTKVTDWFGKLRRFRATRQAILGGECLWDYDSEKLRKEGYLGSWSFDGLKTFNILFVIAAVEVVLSALYPGDSAISRNKFYAIHPELVPLLERVSALVAAGWFCIAFSMSGFLVGWGSIKPEDYTPERRGRATKAYLYLDGAHGLWSQLSWGVLAALLFYNNRAKILDPAWTAIAGISVLPVFGWQAYVNAKKVPELLFRVNRYSDDPPWNRLVLAYIIACVATWVLQEASVALIAVFAYAMQGLQHLVK